MDVRERFKTDFEPLARTPLNDLLAGIETFDVTDEFSDLLDPKKTIFTGKNVSVDAVFSLFRDLNAQHFVQIDRDDRFREIITSCMMLKRLDDYMTNPIPFYINNFMGQANYQAQVRTKTYTLRASKEKAVLLDEVEKFIDADSRTSNYKSRVLLLIDEMVANAFFNAPRDSMGQNVFGQVPRQRNVSLDKSVRVFVAHDSSQLLVGCEDLYGSIDRRVMVDLLCKNFAGDKASIREGAAGAGLGTKMLVDNSTGFSICVKPRVKSIVLCTLKLGVSLKKLDSIPKNIHLTVG